MKFLLVGINSKYIHSNPAIYSLRQYAVKVGKIPSENICLSEYTINELPEMILRDIYEKKCDVCMFSVYIWNVAYVKRISRELKEISPNTEIWWGGPEVSFNTEELLNDNVNIKGVVRLEGEETVSEIMKHYFNMGDLSDIKGITYREDNGIHFNDDRECLDFSKVPFPYEDLSDFDNRIIYYEASRGCPFKCSYCLSGVDKTLRFRDLNTVKGELKFFIDRQVPQVKFVDRTFNSNSQRTVEILKFIRDNDNGVTNFHFEIAGDILSKEEIDILSSLRPALVQLEIGAQSTNPTTLEAVHRITDMDKQAVNVKKLLSNGNIHIHLDLIAGLMYENLDSFKKSFNDLYAFKPHELQLGFLKMLHGAAITEGIEEHEIKYSPYPPYEILSNKYLSYEDILSLKRVENVLEDYYNSGQFTHTIRWLESLEDTPFEMFVNIADFIKAKGYEKLQSSRAKKYEILLSYIIGKDSGLSDKAREYLTLDYYLRENAKKRPDFAFKSDYRIFRDIYCDEKFIGTNLSEYAGTDSASIQRQTHAEKFEYIFDTPKVVIFDYKRRNPVTYDARIIMVE